MRPAKAQRLHRLALIGALAMLPVACASPANEPAAGAANTPEDTARADVAPTGTLRAGLNMGNPVLAVRDASGELRGVAVDVARELAKQIDAPIEFVTYDSASLLAEEAASGKWDVAFLGADPAREQYVTFTPPYLNLEATYLVLKGSKLRALADVDAPGIRIAARPRSAYDLALQRVIKNARLVYPEAGETDVDMLAKGKADVLSSLRDVLIENAKAFPGSRVLDGEFATIQQAVGVPKGRDAAVTYLQEFLTEVKKNGFVAAAIQRTGAKGASVAP